jgi:hypothetical protein
LAAALLFGLFRLALHQVVARQLQAAAAQIPGCTALRYDALTIPYFALQCDVQNPEWRFDAAGDSISARTLQIRRFRPGRTLPRILDVTVDGLVLDVRRPTLAGLRPSLQPLGFNRVTVNADLSWISEGDPQGSWTVEAALQIPDAGQARVSVRMDKVNIRGVALALKNPLNWLVVLPAMELVAASGAYEDRGLLERAIGAAARRNNQPPDEMHRTIVKELQTRSQAAQDPQVRAFWQALAASFTRPPAPLTFEARLRRPLPLSRLLWVRTPADAVRALNLAVHAQPVGPRPPESSAAPSPG